MRIVLLTASLLATALPVAASAQSAIEGRVDRLEREMRAVQRKVFPGGNIQPDIVAPSTSGPIPGTPASSPVADLENRVVSLEKQLGTMTGSIEQTGYRVRQLEEAFNAYKRTTDARLAALEATTTQVGGISTFVEPKPVAPKPAATSGVTRPAAATATAETKPSASPARATQVATVAKPLTGDSAEDDYLYGYRLWQAKLYPEAQTALKAVADKYPKHRRASYAQNLLGRAYLDEGRPSLASIAFYDSFKKFPDGERAPESLYYLAQALMKLNKPADACKVYAELDDTYGSKIDATMRANIVKGRATAKCS